MFCIRIIGLEYFTLLNFESLKAREIKRKVEHVTGGNSVLIMIDVEVQIQDEIILFDKSSVCMF